MGVLIMEQSLENMKNEILLLQNMIYILIQKGQKFGAVLMELFTYLLTGRFLSVFPS